MTLAIFSGSDLPPLLDDANRANGALGSPWTNPTFAQGQGWLINTNQFRSDLSSGYMAAVYGSTTYSPLAVVGLCPAVGTGTTTDAVGLIGWIDASNGYLTSVSTTSCEIWRRAGATWTQVVASASLTLTAGDYLGMALEPSGANVVITLYKKTGAGTWSQLTTYTDTAPSTAKAPWAPGLGGYGNASPVSRMDDLCANDGSAIVTLDNCLPDADVTTTGWTTTPLFSKVNDASDATVIQATAV